MSTLDRRALLRAGLWVACAPAIVRVSSLMPVRAWGGADVYGVSPAMDALDDMREYNKRLADALDKMICPPLVGPDIDGKYRALSVYSVYGVA